MILKVKIIVVDHKQTMHNLTLYTSRHLTDSSMTVVPMGDGEEEEMDGEGWLSWAWSYVPPIMSSASGSDLDSLHEAKIKMENSIFSFGFCVETMKISFLVGC